MEKICFARPTGFFATLKKQVQIRLEQENLPKHGGRYLLFKALFILLMFATAYVALVFWAQTWWQGVILGFALAQSIVMIGTNIMHDAGHGAFSEKVWLNRLMGLTLNLIGGSQMLWRIKHEVLHHSYTNVAELDDDIETNGLLRLHPDQPWQPYHRFQLWYALPLYSLLAISWVITDFVEFFGRRIGPREFRRPSLGSTLLFLAFKGGYLFFSLVLPSFWHPWYLVLLTWLGVQMIVGFTLSLVFQLAHVVEGVEMVSLPPDGKLKDDWAMHQLRTTANFAVGNPLVSWFTGGLNRQIEHHLFPNISHVHYKVIEPSVQQVCQQYGVAYRSYPTVWAAIMAHMRMLATLSRAPA